ncbi:MAG: Fe(2+) transporter permease subunit FeoB [Candidatus Cloacimonetes bacterium]|nr:Fe(2+) transporter permease subunit FeoB [Candidatus Cloacimonadota bacterium]
MKTLKIALAGNPNSGKTTLFNALTGFKQRVGNWPGVTVERKEGQYIHQDQKIEVVDLPGIYSFSAYSLDEKIAREYILHNEPDLVVNIIDASNLERSLYLTTQIIEMKRPLIVALNMMDVAQQRRVKIEVEHLAQHLGCPVVPIIASKKSGLEELKDTILSAMQATPISPTKVYYDSIVEEVIGELQKEVEPYADKHAVDSRWLAIKLLESDPLASELTNRELADHVQAASHKISKHTGQEADIVVLDGRYGFINGLTKDVIHKESHFQRGLTDVIDQIVLNRLFGVPIFLVILYLVFLLTIGVGEPFIEFFDRFFGTIFVDGFAHLLMSINAPAWLITFLAHGIGNGIRTVSTFIPPIFFIFFSLSILEDSGYMSRAAFVMDRFMRYIGLPGKAFIPMLVGFGCNVPAIMATRTLENEKDRILTILINPFMSCGAKLPVYALFAAIFFPATGGRIIFLLYLIGILLAIFTGFIFKSTLFKGETSSFVMELPLYHIPTMNGIFMHTWRRLKSFILRAGKVIILAVIVLSFLNSLGTDGQFRFAESEKSILSATGRYLTPIFSPMGISQDNWPATVGLFTGVFAKEVIIGTLGTLYETLGGEEEIEEEDFQFWQGIREAFSAIPEGFSSEEEEFEIKSEGEMIKRFGGRNNAFAYLLFVLIYMPCVAAIGAIYRETNLKWTLFSVGYLTILAWIIATLFYQFSIFFENPQGAIQWISISIGLYVIIFLLLRFIGKRKLTKRI